MATWLVRQVRRLVKATWYSSAGLKLLAKEHTAFAQELLVLVVVAPLGIWLGRTGTERALLVGSWLLVLVVEILNTAIETTINRISTEQHPLSGAAKDIGSASVFCAIVLAIVVWVLVLVGPHV